ncbi:MAG TPA: 16S rRNA (cytosine(1402)-N(4))-methyltransferase RsmH, partial [Bacillota bacterium]|nr:16S rRNA (cytosine(1402)-N(4))-methyltransferase RsmH [Bacillota bacterium]
LNIDYIDGMIMDLGASSHQFDEKDRGFTYQEDVRLDMRMDTTQDFSAYELVNQYSVKELAEIFWSYGEERWSKRIAEFVVKNRPVETTGQLVEVIKAAVPAAARRGGPHPARRVFQAIRIEVNRELELLDKALENSISVLKPKGRLCVISFHSLEDRIVKRTFRKQNRPCTCPPDLPICICGKKPQVEILTRRPINPTDGEIEGNPRSRSAKLRACKKL